jgi:hypothetical protein
MTAANAFYVPDGELFVATELTRGPWDRHFQHGGPVAALLARGMERELGGDRWQLARIVVEYARPAPIEPCSVRAEVKRTGRLVATLSAELTASGQSIARASGLFVRERELEPQTAHLDGLCRPEQSAPLHLLFIEPGHHTRRWSWLARRVRLGQAGLLDGSAWRWSMAKPQRRRARACCRRRQWCEHGARSECLTFLMWTWVTPTGCHAASGSMEPRLGEQGGSARLPAKMDERRTRGTQSLVIEPRR